MEWYSTVKENEITYVGKMDGTWKYFLIGDTYLQVFR